MSDTKTMNPIDLLTDQQKQCLRLVADMRSSKEIARELGISHHTVDQRIKRALFLLGLSKRIEAARVLKEFENLHPLEGNEGHQPLVYQRPDLPHEMSNWHEGLSFGEWNPADDGDANELREDQSFRMDDLIGPHQNSSPFSVLFEVDRKNNLSWRARSLVMLLIVFTALVGFALLVSLAEGISRLT